MLSLTHLSLFRPGQITIFNSDLHHICPHLHSGANAQLSYLSSGQMSYLSLSQIPTNVTNIIFEPHLDCICLTSNLFFRPVFLLVFLGLFYLALTSFLYASLLDLGALRSFQQRRWNFFCFHFCFLWHSLTIHARYHPVINKKICFDVKAFLELERYCKLSASFINCLTFCILLEDHEL